MSRLRTWCGSRSIAVWTSSSSADTKEWRQGFKYRSVPVRSSIDIGRESMCKCKCMYKCDATRRA